MVIGLKRRTGKNRHVAQTRAIGRVITALILIGTVMIGQERTDQ
jgi:hypothetical protein